MDNIVGYYVYNGVGFNLIFNSKTSKISGTYESYQSNTKNYWTIEGDYIQQTGEVKFKV